MAGIHIAITRVPKPTISFNGILNYRPTRIMDSTPATAGESGSAAFNVSKSDSRTVSVITTTSAASPAAPFELTEQY